MPVISFHPPLPQARCPSTVTMCGWQPERQQMPLVTLIPYRPPFTLPLSLSLFLSRPTPKEKVFAVALPLERLFCSQSWVATSPWAPSSPLFLAVYSSSGLVFLGTKTRQTHRGVDEGPNILLLSKEFRSSEYIYQEREWRKRKGRRESATIASLPPSAAPGDVNVFTLPHNSRSSGSSAAAAIRARPPRGL